MENKYVEFEGENVDGLLLKYEKGISTIEGTQENPITLSNLIVGQTYNCIGHLYAGGSFDTPEGIASNELIHIQDYVTITKSSEYYAIISNGFYDSGTIWSDSTLIFLEFDSQVGTISRINQYCAINKVNDKIYVDNIYAPEYAGEDGQVITWREGGPVWEQPNGGEFYPSGGTGQPSPDLPISEPIQKLDGYQEVINLANLTPQSLYLCTGLMQANYYQDDGTFFEYLKLGGNGEYLLLNKVNDTNVVIYGALRLIGEDFIFSDSSNLSILIDSDTGSITEMWTNAIITDVNSNPSYCGPIYVPEEPGYPGTILAWDEINNKPTWVENQSSGSSIIDIGDNQYLLGDMKIYPMLTYETLEQVITTYKATGSATLHWILNGLETDFSVNYYGEADSSILLTIHGRLIKYALIESEDGFILPIFAEEQETEHLINCDATTSLGEYNYQFQFKDNIDRKYTMLYEVANSLYDYYRNTRIPATGTYTEYAGETDRLWLIQYIYPYNRNQVALFMIDPKTGTTQEIQTGAVNISDHTGYEKFEEE